MMRPVRTFLALWLFAAPLAARQPAVSDTDWTALPKILQRIVPPCFPDRAFDIRQYGAVGDGSIDCTSAIERAIIDCHGSGGGKVLVPPGIFATGAIRLLSNVNLVISEGATLRFSTDPKAYLPLVRVRWEGVECMNYAPLIYAFEQENIAVTGAGVLDGQASDRNWWRWKGNGPAGSSNQKEAREKLMTMGEKSVPIAERVFGEGSFLRPNFFVPYRCMNVLVEGVTFVNSPMWFVNPEFCTNVTVRRITVEGNGPNNDGCDPESCTDVLIEKSVFNTGDDCIAIKSGRNNDGRRLNVPSGNIVIRGCTMKNGHGGVVVGSEISAGVRNVFVEDCRMDSPNLDRALRIKTNSVRGGMIENIFLRRIEVGQVADAVVKIDFFYEEGDVGVFTPVVRNIGIEDLTCRKCVYAIWIRAYDRSPVTNIRLRRCVFQEVAKKNIVEHAELVVEGR